jgi:MFS family permease
MEVPHINDAQQAIAYDAAAIQEQPISPLRKWGSLVVLSLALAIIVIDTTLLNVSLKTIINDLHTTIEVMQWVITAYSLVLAAFTITGGRLGDLYGRKKMFMLGAVIFAVGSFLASISKNVGTMIAGEAIIEGIGAALMMPATASILVANFKGKERGIAFGIWGGIAPASSAIGPILGGWLTTNYSWRWGFRINVVVAAMLLLGSVIVRESRDTEEKNRIDFIGVILSALGMLSIVFAFIKANTYGWIKVKAPLMLFHHTLDLGSLSVVPLFIALGLVILVLFILWERYLERSGKTPLVSLELLKNYQFTVGTLNTAVKKSIPTCSPK